MPASYYEVLRRIIMTQKELTGTTNEDSAMTWNSEADAIKNEFIMTLSHQMRMPLSPQTRDVLGILAIETMNGAHPGINVLLEFAESYRTQLSYLLSRHVSMHNTE